VKEISTRVLAEPYPCVPELYTTEAAVYILWGGWDGKEYKETTHESIFPRKWK